MQVVSLVVSTLVLLPSVEEASPDPGGAATLPAAEEPLAPRGNIVFGTGIAALLAVPLFNEVRSFLCLGACARHVHVRWWGSLFLTTAPPPCSLRFHHQTPILVLPAVAIMLTLNWARLRLLLLLLLLLLLFDAVAAGWWRLLVVGAADPAGPAATAQVTGLPPYLGMLGGLGVLWLLTDVIHAGEKVGHATNNRRNQHLCPVSQAKQALVPKNSRRCRQRTRFFSPLRGCLLEQSQNSPWTPFISNCFDAAGSVRGGSTARRASRAVGPGQARHGRNPLLFRHFALRRGARVLRPPQGLTPIFLFSPYQLFLFHHIFVGALESSGLLKRSHCRNFNAPAPLIN